MSNRDNPLIASILKRMTLDQKVGALMTLGLSGTLLTPRVRDCILKFNCSGFRWTPRIRRFGSYIDPNSRQTVVEIKDDTGYKKGTAPSASLTELKQFLSQLQQLAISRPRGIPLHFSLDQEGGASGEINVGPSNMFPSAMGLAATGDPELVYEASFARGRQLRSVGVNWSHTPVVDINTDPRNPEICIRALSDRVEDVVNYSRQICLGLQDAGVIAAAKHFPGRGDSPTDAHFNMPVIEVDMNTLWERELLPYRILIEDQLVPTIMIAHSIYPAIDKDEVSTVSKKLLTDLLRDKMQFGGVITTDSMTMAGIASRYGVPEACAQSLAAGADIVLMKADNEFVELTFNAIKRFVEEKKISESELDDKVYRVLNMKYEYGLFHWGSGWSENPEETALDEQVVQVAENASRRSILIARDRKNSLPLSPDEKVLVVQQMQAHPNTLNNHSAMFYLSCLQHSDNVGYLEIAPIADEEDMPRLEQRIGDYDTVVVTNFYQRGSRTNTGFAAEVIEKHPDKKVVLLTNTPYPLSIPDNADTVVVAFGPTPRHREMLAGVLYGKLSPEGVWPLAFELKK